VWSCALLVEVLGRLSLVGSCVVRWPGLVGGRWRPVGREPGCDGVGAVGDVQAVTLPGAQDVAQPARLDDRVRRRISLGQPFN